MKSILSLVVSLFVVASEAAPVRQPGAAFSGKVVTEKHEVLLDASDFSLSFNNGTLFRMGTTYNYTLLPDLQVGASVGLLAASGTTVFAAVAGPTINLPFGGDLKDAFFVLAKIGFYTVSIGNASDSGFAFDFGVGKRFKIYEHLAYSPSFSVVKSGNGDATFVVKFFSASLLF